MRKYQHTQKINLLYTIFLISPELVGKSLYHGVSSSNAVLSQLELKKNGCTTYTSQGDTKA